MTAKPSATEVYLRSQQIRERHNISEMTLWRRLRVSDFPKPMVVNRVRYWPLSEIEEWERKQVRLTVGEPQKRPNKRAVKANEAA